MSNLLIYKDKNFAVGDMISLFYKIREGEKTRIQEFSGILLKIRGDSEITRMITVRKISHSGIGVERIIPIASPNLTEIKLVKKSNYSKAKAYFVRDLSDQELRKKLYSHDRKKS